MSVLASRVRTIRPSTACICCGLPRPGYSPSQAAARPCCGDCARRVRREGTAHLWGVAA